MGRRIMMTGKDSKYIHVHGKDAGQSERNILLTGDNAEFVEVTVDDQTYERVTDKKSRFCFLICLIVFEKGQLLYCQLSFFDK